MIFLKLSNCDNLTTTILKLKLGFIFRILPYLQEGVQEKLKNEQLDFKFKGSSNIFKPLV